MAAGVEPEVEVEVRQGGRAGWQMVVRCTPSSTIGEVAEQVASPSRAAVWSSSAVCCGRRGRVLGEWERLGDCDIPSRGKLLVIPRHHVGTPIVLPDGRVVLVPKLRLDMSVPDARRLAQEEVGSDQALRLFRVGEELDETKTLAECGVTQQSILHAVPQRSASDTGGCRVVLRLSEWASPHLVEMSALREHVLVGRAEESGAQLSYAGGIHPPREMGVTPVIGDTPELYGDSPVLLFGASPPNGLGPVPTEPPEWGPHFSPSYASAATRTSAFETCIFAVHREESDTSDCCPATRYASAGAAVPARRMHTSTPPLRLPVRTADTTGILKQRVWERTGIAPAEQRLDTDDGPLVGGVRLDCLQEGTEVRLDISAADRPRIPLGVVRPPSGKTEGITWLGDDALTAGMQDGCIRVWSFPSSEDSTTLLSARPSLLIPSSGPPARPIAACRGGTSLLVGSPFRKAMVYDVESGNEALVLHTGSDVWCVAAASRGSILVTGHGDGSFTCWDERAGGEEVGRMQALKTGVQCLAASPDGRRVAVGAGEDKVACCWSVAGRVEEERWFAPGWVSHISFVPTGILTASVGYVSLLEIGRSSPFLVPPTPVSTYWAAAEKALISLPVGPAVLGMSTPEDGRWIAASYGVVRMWNGKGETSICLSRTGASAPWQGDLGGMFRCAALFESPSPPLGEGWRAFCRMVRLASTGPLLALPSPIGRDRLRSWQEMVVRLDVSIQCDTAPFRTPPCLVRRLLV